ncbi:MAG: preprotein translocase subunit SecG [Candidatus Omnitrophota bacterium]
MMGLVIVIHIIICALLITIILIQSGRGGGLVENFSGIESMLGTKTNAFLTKTTTVLSVLFFITCLSLAFLSLRQSRSLMRDVKAEKPAAVENVTAAAVVSNQTGAAPIKP